LPEYHEDLSDGLAPSTKSASTLIQEDELTASEFWCGIIRDKTHYAELRGRQLWICGNCIYASFVLDGDYVPKTLTEVVLFREMQIFMYAVFEEKLKTDKGKSLDSAY
jgi:hypothetical protein